MLDPLWTAERFKDLFARFILSLYAPDLVHSHLMFHLLGRSAGVEELYVHVVADNTAAVQLYCHSCDFEVEAEEAHGQAQLLSRPRRLLLHRRLALPGP